MKKLAYLAVVGLVGALTHPAVAEPFSINDALRESAKSHPGVGEAAANRRGTEAELRQTQSTLLPQVRVDAYYGREKFDQSVCTTTVCGANSFGNVLPVPTLGPGVWRNGSNESVVIRQLLFDGFAS